MVTINICWLIRCARPCWKHYIRVLSPQLCSTFGDPMACDSLGSSVHEIFLARILDCHFLLPGSFWTRDETHISHGSCTDRSFTTGVTRETHYRPSELISFSQKPLRQVLLLFVFWRFKNRNEGKWPAPHLTKCKIWSTLQWLPWDGNGGQQNPNCLMNLSTGCRGHADMLSLWHA